MRKKWAALLLAMGLCAGAGYAAGFGLAVASATVNNFDTNNNDIADVGEMFTITGAPFASYRSDGNAPVINDNDLDRYSANITATATEVVGNKVRYQGTFQLVYNGPVYSNVIVETGTLDVRAEYQPGGPTTLGAGGSTEARVVLDDGAAAAPTGALEARREQLADAVRQAARKLREAIG